MSGVAGAGHLVIDLGAIAANWKRLSAAAPGARCGAPVKADAYGLGARQVVPALYRAGCRDFFVAHPGEALAIRDVVPGDARLFVLHGLAAAAEEMAAAGIIPVLSTAAQLRDALALAERRGGLGVALHVDTGMNRLGLDMAEAGAMAGNLGKLRVELVLSHLACADIPGHPLNPLQLDRFRDVIRHFPGVTHSLANSSGIFLGPDYHFGLVRPGAALYGINPLTGKANPMRPVVRLSAPVLQVRRVDAPGTVGYGAEHAVAGPAVIATVAVGYADGYPRALGGRGIALIAGTRVPIAGRISMDLITLDVTALPPGTVQPGSEAVLIGEGLDVDELGALAGTIGYHILTSLGPRYTRSWVDHA